MIAAAGSGSRLGAGGPKAFVQVAGKPLVTWSLEALAAAEAIGGVVVAAPVGHEPDLEAIAGDAIVVTGGASRSASVASALACVETELVVIHDAARPLATAELFDRVVATLAGAEYAAGVIAAAPAADTLKRAAGEPPVVTESLNRDDVWMIQTPQAFRTDALRAALDVSDAELESATDDAMLVERAGGTVLIEASTRPNLKVTTASDAAVAAMILRGSSG